MLYGKNLEEFAGQTAYDYDDNNGDYYGGGDCCDYDTVCLHSATKRYFSHIYVITNVF